ncbi:MAG: hypothetical protein KIT14_25780 [bacterium]|nr:hypothetical protein [bacterium]
MTRLAPLLGSLAARLLGLVLLVAAYAKAIDPQRFADEMALLLPLGGIPWPAVAVGAIAYEAGLGTALLLGWRHPLVLAATNLTFVVFLAIVTWQWLSPGAAGTSCGCFGQLVERTPQQAFVEDVVFLALSALAWMGRTPRARASRLLPALAVAAAAGAFALAAPSLPLDDHATALAPGVAVADTPLAGVVSELATGRHLVLLFDRADPATRAAIAPLNARLGLPGAPLGVWGVAPDDPTQTMAFLWAAGPAFPVRSMAPTMLRSLYRTLPRSALVDEGRVVATWSGFPPDAVLDALARGESP